jgi:hypothetical protein
MPTTSPAGLTDQQRNAAVMRLEAIDRELGAAASVLHDADEVRAAAMLMAAQRSILAACHLIRPPSPQELVTVIEQRARS